MLTPRPNRNIFFEVAEIDRPDPEPFMVVRIDTGDRIGDGVAGLVESLHMTREEARIHAESLTAIFYAELH